MVREERVANACNIRSPVSGTGIPAVALGGSVGTAEVEVGNDNRRTVDRELADNAEVMRSTEVVADTWGTGWVEVGT